MKILIALNHPAHYYLFKFIYLKLISKGHDVRYVIKEKDILEKLLLSEKVAYTKISQKKNVKGSFSIVLKGGIELLQRDLKLLKYVREFVPDIMMGTDIAITHIGKLMRLPSFVYNEDDFEINKFFCKSSYPFANFIVAPAYTSVGKYGSKKISYNGIQKMAYLNPKYFSPDKRVLQDLKVSTDENFFIIRLISLTSAHDIEGKHKGIDLKLTKEIINYLEKYGKVFISSEDVLPRELLKYQLKISPNNMHSVMAFASLFIGDSQSMCAEAGILGTPFIRFNDFVGKIKYLSDIEDNYKLGWGVKTNEPMRIFEIIKELFLIKNYKKEWDKRGKKLFDDKIDLTAFSVWFIENYPNSIKIMKGNPNYQYNFK